MAQRTPPTHQPTNHEACAQKAQTLQNCPGDVPCQLLPRTSHAVEHPSSVHVDLLTPYRETPTHGPNYQRPPPDLVEGEEEYEVKKILDSRRFGRRRKLQYLIKWKGYPDSENQWVDKDDVFADKALQEFKTLNPTSEVHIRHLHIPENHIPTSSAEYMSSPTPSTIEDVIC